MYIFDNHARKSLLLVSQVRRDGNHVLKVTADLSTRPATWRVQWHYHCPSLFKVSRRLLQLLHDNKATELRHNIGDRKRNLGGIKCDRWMSGNVCVWVSWFDVVYRHYVELVNGAIRHLRRTGYLDRLKVRWWDGRSECGRSASGARISRMYGSVYMSSAEPSRVIGRIQRLTSSYLVAFLPLAALSSLSH